ncbi:MAG: YbaN family protein [Acidimicrobiia bacterium]
MAHSVEPDSDRRLKSPLLRGVFLVLGLITLALIPLSYLPGIPTFDLIILSAFFFSLSSERMHDWMLNHRYFGRVIKGYRDRGLTKRMKWTAAVAIVLSLALSGVFLVDILWIRILLVLVGIYAVGFVFSRPTWRAED